MDTPRDIMNDMRKSSGSIDLTDEPEEQHITESVWSEGETVDATESNEGKQTHSFWPDEIDDPNDITELQRTVVRTAVMNQHLDSNSVGEMIGKQGGYVRATLKRVCPRWYNNVFKPSTTDSNFSTSDFLSGIGKNCPNCGEQIVLHEKLNGKTLLRCRCEKIPIILDALPDIWNEK